MKRLLVSTAALALAVAGTGLSSAAPADKLPKITGGGHTENNNSGGPDQTAFGGFVAQATGPGQTSSGAAATLFGTAVTTYPADGQVQARTATNDGNETLLRVHGEVVCIANLGPSSEVDGGGNPSEDVWEIRFEIKSSSIPVLQGGFASILVQDNGREDFADESGAGDNFTNPECGNVTQFQLEPHQGQITVH